eukprot:scaffold54226_cov40-Prasinocladus_malaysianus.AAC.3
MNEPVAALQNYTTRLQSHGARIDITQRYYDAMQYNKIPNSTTNTTRHDKFHHNKYCEVKCVASKCNTMNASHRHAMQCIISFNIIVLYDKAYQISQRASRVCIYIALHEYVEIQHRASLEGGDGGSEVAYVPDPGGGVLVPSGKDMAVWVPGRREREVLVALELSERIAADRIYHSRHGVVANHAHQLMQQSVCQFNTDVSPWDYVPHADGTISVEKCGPRINLSEKVDLRSDSTIV